MKRPTANVSGDNPGFSLWPARRDQTLFHLGVAPLTYLPRTGSSNTVTGNAPLLAITDVFHGRGTGTLYPREYPFAVREMREQ